MAGAVAGLRTNALPAAGAASFVLLSKYAFLEYALGRYARLSACTSACTLGGSDRRRPSALTATGSVLASTAPSTNAMLHRDRRHRPGHGRDRGRRRQHQANRQHGHRPPHRPQITPRQFLARRVQQRRQHHQADHIRWHMDRREPGTRATTSPAITSKDGAGTRSRPAKAATTVPSTTRNKMVSTPRMPLTSSVQPTGWVPTRLPGAPPPAYPAQLPASVARPANSNERARLPGTSDHPTGHNLQPFQ